MLTVGSLFSGAGGFDLGFERAGMTVRWQSEIDKHASMVLAHHWPKVRNYGDITTTGRLPAVDVVCGGFPCQDVSVAGRRAGLAGERSGLWWEFRRVLAEVRPTWVVIENVPGLLSSNRGNDMGTVLWSLGQLGYWWAYRILDAQWFGLAQRRKRVFIVGHLGDRRGPATVLLEPESREGHPPPGRAARQDVAGSLGCGSGQRGWSDDLDRSGAFIPLLEVGARTNGDGARDGDGIGEFGDPMYTLQAGKQHGVAAFDVRQITSKDNRSSVEPGKPSPTLNADSGMHVATWPASVAPTLNTHFGDKMGLEDQHALHGAGLFVPAAIRTANTSANGHGIADNVAHTLDGANGQAVAFNWQNGGNEGYAFTEEATGPLDTSQTKAVYQPHTAVRRLTPRECERLQGFSDDWTLVDGMSDSARYRLMGNAVAVPVAEWIGRRIADYERSAS